MVGVIGATGHLGNVLTRELIKQGFRVRAIIPEWEDTLPIKYEEIDIVRADITNYSILVLHSNANVSSEKAIKELGYSFRPIKESIRDSYLWFKEQGKII